MRFFGEESPEKEDNKNAENKPAKNVKAFRYWRTDMANFFLMNKEILFQI